MDQIREQVRRARRRLSLELFLNRLLRCWFASFVLVVVALAVPKLWAVDLPANWPLWCVLTGLTFGLLFALTWTWWRGRSELEAGVEIDRRYGLKERVASSLTLSPEEAKTPAGQALLTDAMRAVGRIDVDEKFKIRFQQRAWLPLVPALMAFVLVVFVDNRIAESRVDPKTPELTKEQHDNATKKLRERLAKRRKEAAKKGLKDAEGLFRELEKQTEKMAKAKDAGRKQSLVKINDLAKQLEKRRQQLGGEQQMRKQFKKLNNMNKGPADKMVEAMKKGDFKAAKQELQKLKQQLENGKLDKQAKQELQQQLKQIEEKMAEAKEARQQAMENLKKQIEQEKKRGDLSRAGELQQKLDQMQQQQNQMNKLNQLAQKMGECQQCMKAGDGKGAAAALDQMMKQMDQLQQEMDEGELLDMAMDQLQMAKDAMGCKACQGEGCQACQGGGQGSDRFSEKSGNGMGAGRGFGSRPDEKNDVSFRNSRVRQKPGKGAAVVVGEADGANLRGQVVESIKEQMATDASTPADPIVLEQLPKSRREHNEEYFNSFQE
ncbi:MAG: hypothetical protein GXP24_07225 [Planctomycetes bacterium]|nr:hypothetical protein [Planctomycetota bacterium]